MISKMKKKEELSTHTTTVVKYKYRVVLLFIICFLSSTGKYLK